MNTVSSSFRASVSKTSAFATTSARRARLDSAATVAHRSLSGRRTQHVSHLAPDTLERLWATRGLTSRQAARLVDLAASTEDSLAVSVGEVGRGNLRRLHVETAALCATLVSTVVAFAWLMLS